jgi:hypothetical protein
LAPTAFSAVVDALAKLTCTCGAIAFANVGPKASLLYNSEMNLIDFGQDVFILNNFVRVCLFQLVGLI